MLELPRPLESGTIPAGGRAPPASAARPVQLRRISPKGAQAPEPAAAGPPAVVPQTGCVRDAPMSTRDARHGGAGAGAPAVQESLLTRLGHQSRQPSAGDSPLPAVVHKVEVNRDCAGAREQGAPPRRWWSSRQAQAAAAPRGRGSRSISAPWAPGTRAGGSWPAGCGSWNPWRRDVWLPLNARQSGRVVAPAARGPGSPATPDDCAPGTTGGGLTLRRRGRRLCCQRPHHQDLLECQGRPGAARCCPFSEPPSSPLSP